MLAFVAGLSQAMVAAGVPPTQAAAVWDVLKADKWVRDRAEITGVRADSLASQEEVDTLRQARAQAQQAETERMQMMQGAEAAGKAAPMVRELAAAGQATNGGGR